MSSLEKDRQDLLSTIDALQEGKHAYNQLIVSVVLFFKHFHLRFRLEMHSKERMLRE